LSLLGVADAIRAQKKQLITCREGSRAKDRDQPATGDRGRDSLGPENRLVDRDLGFRPGQVIGKTIPWESVVRDVRRIRVEPRDTGRQLWLKEVIVSRARWCCANARRWHRPGRQRSRGLGVFLGCAGEEGRADFPENHRAAPEAVRLRDEHTSSR